MSTSTDSRTGGVAGFVVGVTAALVVLAPLLRPGFVLAYDMVFVPRPPITATTLGLDGSVPRAVPTDLVVALLSRVLPGDALQKLILVAVFVLAGWGVARLIPRRAAAAVAALAYVWNPYVAERLAIGHWTMLLGYALLPWAVASALAARGSTKRLPVLCLWLFAAALCGATVAVEVTAVVLVVLLWRRVRAGLPSAGVVIAFGAAANAPWWVPTVLRPGGIPADPRGITAFAAHADTPFGLLPSLLTLGGIWNQAVVPPERSVSLLVLMSMLAVLTVLALGTRDVARAWDGAGAALLVAGLAALLIAAAASVPGLSALQRLVVLHLPGGGLLRDGQKYLAVFALCVALCAGAAFDRLLMTRRADAAVAAIAVAITPVVVLPGLAWGIHGRLGVSHYPTDWFAVRRIIAASPASGDVAVLPWRLYRRYEWNGNRVLLDPASRFFGRTVLVDDDLPLSQVTVRGEDPRAARVNAALARGENVTRVLADLGVRFIVVEHTTGQQQVAASALVDAARMFSSPQLDLYELQPTRQWNPHLPDIAAIGLAVSATAGLMAGVTATGRRQSGYALLSALGRHRTEERAT